MMRRFTGVVIFSSCLLSVPAEAEVLTVTGIYPAANNGAAALESIAVEEFGGLDGPALSIRIEDVLRDAQLGGRPYYRIFPARSDALAEGVLRGTAEAEQRINRYTEERESCVTKDAAGKCTEKAKTKIDCRRRTIELALNLRLIARDGALLYSTDRPETFEDSRCEGDSDEQRSRSDILRGLIAKVAARLGAEFVPSARADSIRVNESRKGLSKPDAAQFKQAVALTKTDPGAACRVWAGLAAANQTHLPTRYNLALCAESEGRGAAAVEQYQQLLRLKPNLQVAREGLARAEARELAREQLRARGWAG